MEPKFPKWVSTFKLVLDEQHDNNVVTIGEPNNQEKHDQYLQTAVCNNAGSLYHH